MAVYNISYHIMFLSVPLFDALLPACSTACVRRFLSRAETARGGLRPILSACSLHLQVDVLGELSTDRLFLDVLSTPPMNKQKGEANDRGKDNMVFSALAFQQNTTE